MKTIKYGTGVGGCNRPVYITNVAELANAVKEDTKVNTTLVSVDGKMFTKTLVFIDGVFSDTIWNDEAGQPVIAPDINLINNSVCQQLLQTPEEPVDINDAFGITLETVDEYTP